MKEIILFVNLILLTTFVATAQNKTLSSSKTNKEQALANDLSAAASIIDTSSIWLHLRALADDSMTGRRPGTAGDKLTVNYLAKAFKEAGLTAPYGESYLQPVYLLHGSATGTFSFSDGEKQNLLNDSLFVLRTPKAVDIDLVIPSFIFVGHGITAPEFKWDDYKGRNVEGKVVVIVDGEPNELINRSFGTQGSLTYQGPFTIREQMAKEHGARGVVFLSNTKIISAVQKRWRQNDFTVLQDGLDKVRTNFFITLSNVAAEQFAAASHTSLDELKKKAGSKDFIPFTLSGNGNVSIHAQTTPFTSHNVVGYIKGSDPAFNKECIVYSTHWDGYGIGLPQRGDSIYNAASDNAGGISEMIAIAKAVKALQQKPKRSIVFVASTAEESGKLGAEAYVRSPLFSLEKTVLAIGMDIFSPWGKVTGFHNQGYGYTTVDALLQQLAYKKERPYRGPQTASVFASSDQHMFALRGIPAIFAGAESTSPVYTQTYVDSVESKITIAHTPFDEIRSDWDLQSAVDEARLLFEVGVITANDKNKPRWTVDCEFSRAAKKK